MDSDCSRAVRSFAIAAIAIATGLPRARGIHQTARQPIKVFGLPGTFRDRLLNNHGTELQRGRTGLHPSSADQPGRRLPRATDVMTSCGCKFVNNPPISDECWHHYWRVPPFIRPRLDPDSRIPCTFQKILEITPDSPCMGRQSR